MFKFKRTDDLEAELKKLKVSMDQCKEALKRLNGEIDKLQSLIQMPVDGEIWESIRHSGNYVAVHEVTDSYIRYDVLLPDGHKEGRQRSHRYFLATYRRAEPEF